MTRISVSRLNRFDRQGEYIPCIATIKPRRWSDLLYKEQHKFLSLTHKYRRGYPNYPTEVQIKEIEEFKVLTAQRVLQITQKHTCNLGQNRCVSHNMSRDMTKPTKWVCTQPGHPPGLIRVFAVCIKKPWIFSYPLSAQRRLIRLGRLILLALSCRGWYVWGKKWVRRPGFKKK